MIEHIMLIELYDNVPVRPFRLLDSDACDSGCLQVP